MRIRNRLGSLAACVAAATGLTVAAAGSASAVTTTVQVWGTSGTYLGSGYFHGGGSGAIEVYDAFCDGDNGIIAAAYVWRNSSWTTSGLVSVRGCGSTNYNGLADNSPRPAYGEEVKFTVCKLLPDGTWKDCINTYVENY
ncbi:hypothetical protein [Streptomyces cyaneus]|uniref:hypothetical protein n=1 Tax=Streptomyces cyaneus TaxID=1904 RepID=UPI000FF87E5A|nr:hypothetical protein [Streptomyces cyaneus]